MTRSGEAQTTTWPGHSGGWTADDLANLPDDGSRYEIVDGSLHVTPEADASHRDKADEILTALRSSAPPGWQVVGQVAVRLPNGLVTPDVAVLRPGGGPDRPTRDADDVALVVEVESPHSRRHDRCVKAGLYAEAGIESYWRVERTSNGPVAHLYTKAESGHYHLHRAVQPGQVVTAELPYAVQVAPATWH